MPVNIEVANQKVSITLRSVVALTNEYNRTVEFWRDARKKSSSESITTWNARKQALEFVIATLGLPIPTVSN